jgi:biopolymer transport protein ExbD
MRGKRAQGADEAEIDLTPMLDIVFIMLIFFIVTSTFIKEPGVDINRPDAETTEKVTTVAVLIAITRDNRIYIDKKEIDRKAVRVNVERMLAENPKGAIVIQADKDSEAGVMMEVMEAVRDAGASATKISTNETE